MVSAVTSAFGDPTRARDLPLRARRRRRRRHRERGRRAVRAPPQRRAPPPREARRRWLPVRRGRAGRAATPSVRAAGRPSKRYCAGPLDATLALPLKHDDLLAGLLARALDALGPDQAEVLADEVGYEYGMQLAARMDPTEGHRSVRAALGAVADALTAHGFAAHTEARGGSLAIVSECCPFGETAHDVPARRVRARPRHDPRDARRPLRRDVAALRDQPPRRRRPLRRPRLTWRRAYLDHASSSPLRPAALEAMLPYLARPPRRSRPPARGGPGHPRRGRDRPRAGRGAVRRPPTRGRVHRERHRGGRTPRSTARSHALRAQPVRPARRHHRGRALRRCSRRRGAPGSHQIVEVGVDGVGRFDPAAVARRDRRRHRAGVGAARQPRGRHGAAGRRRSIARRPCARRGRARRRVRGRRARRRRLRARSAPTSAR